MIINIGGLGITGQKILFFLWSTFGRLIFNILDWAVPKRRKLVIFAGCNGDAYRDNSRYLFEYALENTDLDAYWCTSNKSVFRELSLKFDGRVISGRSLFQLWIFLRASTVFVSHGEFDVNRFFLSRYKLVIALWHGIPMKKIGWSREDGEKFWRRQTRHFDRVVLCSDYEKSIVKEIFKINEEDFLVSGYPRNDHLLSLDNSLLPNFKWLAETTILYAPTYRWDGNGSDGLSEIGISFEELEDFLQKNNSRIIIRSHNLDSPSSTSEEQKKESRIIIGGFDEFPDINDLLPFVDVLITDFSSIFHDFNLLDRPMIFFPFDLQEYSLEPGLLYEYEENIPGPIVLDKESFFKTLSECINNPEDWGEKRRIIRDKFHHFQDGKACQRILQSIFNKQEDCILMVDVEGSNSQTDR